MKKLVLAATLLLLPSVSMAANFAKAPLFLSHTPVTEGQSVRIYAVVSNTDTTSFTGTLVFYDGATKIGSNELTLAAGATQTVSTNWTPTAGGKHAVNAQLVGKDSSIAEQVSANFTIDAKSAVLGSSTQSAAVIDSSASIQKNIAGVSPQVASASAPVFSVIDGARNSVADVLDSQISSTKKKVSETPKPGIVAGASTEDVKVENPTTGFWYWLYTIYLYALLAVRWLVGSAGIFYPLLAVVFLYFIWRLYRRFRRPAWQR